MLDLGRRSAPDLASTGSLSGSDTESAQGYACAQEKNPRTRNERPGIPIPATLRIHMPQSPRIQSTNAARMYLPIRTAEEVVLCLEAQPFLPFIVCWCNRPVCLMSRLSTIHAPRRRWCCASETSRYWWWPWRPSCADSHAQKALAS
jgi:hypothetical protein